MQNWRESGMNRHRIGAKVARKWRENGAKLAQNWEYFDEYFRGCF
jgi:hypothetical protein